MIFVLLINVKMPTIVCILTFMSRKKSCSAGLSMIYFITSRPGVVFTLTTIKMLLKGMIIYASKNSKFHLFVECSLVKHDGLNSVFVTGDNEKNSE